MEQGIQESIQTARRLREKLLADPYRPQYHIVTPEGSYRPFDPNAALFWKGRYHLMYIIQTEKGHCWAHISSHDLLHWRHHRLALEAGGIDSGIFSGGIFIDKAGIPTITYWGLGENAGICLATSTDDELDEWPDPQEIARVQLAMLDAHAVDVGAAGRAQVVGEQRLAVPVQPQMMPRDGRKRDHRVGARIAAHRERAVTRREAREAEAGVPRHQHRRRGPHCE